MEKKELLEIMRRSTYKPLTVDELVKELSIDNIPLFLELLRELEQEGEIILTRKQKYGLPERMGLVTGRLQGNPKGFAFLLPSNPGRPDVYISQEDLNGALHNDRVVVRLHPATDRGRPEGEVIRILKRANRQVVGSFERNRDYGFVVPDDKRLSIEIFIDASDTGGARHGDKVVVEITRWREGRRSPEGKVKEVLGQANQPGVDVLAIVRKYQLPEAFPGKALRELEALPDRVLSHEFKNRRDLRDLKTVTIDGDDAKDLDDAISIQELPGGGWRLLVHIADVSYYVREGTALDEEAFARGSSVYLVDRVIPMLPPKLSNGICSLNAGEDRLSLTVLMEIDQKGIVQKHDIFPSVIKVTERMTYDVVLRLLEGGDQELQERYRDLLPEFRLMDQLARKLFSRRLKRGAVDFNFPEYKVVLDDRGKPQEIIKGYRTRSESIIEEFMILANETIAEHMYWREAPFIYRVHEEPGPDDVLKLNDFLHNLGYHVKVSNGKVTPEAFQAVVNKVKDRPEEQLVNTVVLRSMRHALYGPDNLEHFGLAAPYYCHFTAPIRRYPDLVIHRIIREYLAGGPSKKRLKFLERQMPVWAEQSSVREKAAEEAERESVELKMVEFMERHLGKVFDGTISGVTSFGLFVELENGVEGLVHVSTITDDYYSFQEKQMALLGEHTRKIYRLGDPVTVLVTKVNVADRQIDFELVTR
jgi:ribonuclease R